MLATFVRRQSCVNRAGIYREFAARLKIALPGHSVTVVQSLQVHVKGPDGSEATSYLDNAYTEYNRDPASKDETLQRHVTSFIETLTLSGRVDPERIVPVIKDRAWPKEMSKVGGKTKKAMKLVVDDLNGDLVIVYAEDGERNIRYFSPEDFEKTGIERGALRSVAVENLRRILPDVEVHAGELLSMLTAGGDYVASLLLLDDIWSGGQIKVDGEIVVAVPSRDVLLVTGSRNEKGIRELRKLAKEAAADNSYSLSDLLFVYRNGKFERY